MGEQLQLPNPGVQGGRTIGLGPLGTAARRESPAEGVHSPACPQFITCVLCEGSGGSWWIGWEAVGEGGGGAGEEGGRGRGK